MEERGRICREETQVGVVERVREEERGREKERERKQGGMWKGLSGRRERESEMKVGDERGITRKREREGEGERGGGRNGLDDVILDIRWNLHCASTLVIPRTQTVQ